MMDKYNLRNEERGKDYLDAMMDDYNAEKDKEKKDDDAVVIDKE